jgi:hypothetical protein
MAYTPKMSSDSDAVAVEETAPDMTQPPPPEPTEVVEETVLTDAAVDPVVEEVVPEVRAPVVNPESTKQSSPCTWNINPLDDEDLIEAYNSISGERFEGTIAEFNAFLRG